MNKSEKIGIITGLVALSLLARYNSAIAETFKTNDKKLNQSEQFNNIAGNKSNDIKLTLDSMPPDTIKEIKDRFYKIVVANPQEKSDADNIRNNAMKSPIWNFIKEEIIFIDETADNDYERFVVMTLLLDPEHKYGLSQQAFNIVQGDTAMKRLFDVLVRSINSSVILKEKQTELKEKQTELKEKQTELKEAQEVLKRLKELERQLIGLQKALEATQNK